MSLSAHIYTKPARRTSPLFHSCAADQNYLGRIYIYFPYPPRLFSSVCASARATLPVHAHPRAVTHSLTSATLFSPRAALSHSMRITRRRGREKPLVSRASGWGYICLCVCVMCACTVCRCITVTYVEKERKKKYTIYNIYSTRIQSCDIHNSRHASYSRMYYICGNTILHRGDTRVC